MVLVAVLTCHAVRRPASGAKMPFRYRARHLLPAPAPFLSALSVKDALSQLDSISGNKDRNSRVIDPDELLHCADWLDASAWKPTAAGIPECHHAGLLYQSMLSYPSPSFPRCYLTLPSGWVGVVMRRLEGGDRSNMAPGELHDLKPQVVDAVEKLWVVRPCQGHDLHHHPGTCLLYTSPSPRD